MAAVNAFFPMSEKIRNIFGPHCTVGSNTLKNYLLWHSIFLQV